MRNSVTNVEKPIVLKYCFFSDGAQMTWETDSACQQMLGPKTSGGFNERQLHVVVTEDCYFMAGWDVEDSLW